LPARSVNDQAIEEIRDRCDLVDLVGEYLGLEKKGKNYVGLCPFHHEKTPSFTVSPEKQLFYCFGCNEGGDLFKFIMNMEGVSFPEALRMLAERAGVTLPEEKKNASRESRREPLVQLNQLAMQYFYYMLNSTQEGKKSLDYLTRRGIDAQAVEKFCLGYAPAKWDAFLKLAQKKGFSPEDVIQAGLAVARDDGKGYYDRFRNRIMFPIFDIRGKVIGFGGRTMEEDPKGPKYLNSPQTSLFDKSSVLYGLYQARTSIRRERRAVIMEGYTDVIVSHQQGIENAVASLGTALTTRQARMLRHQAGEVVMAYDADEGGKSATLRGMNILRQNGLIVKVAEIPPGYDPDSYLREKGAENLRQLIDEAPHLLDYQIERLKKEKDITTVEGKTSFCEEYFPLLENATRLEKDHYLKKVGEELGISEAALREELKRHGRRNRGSPEKNSNNMSITGKNNIIRDSGLDSAENLLLNLLISFEGVFDKVDEESSLDMFAPVMQKIVEACRILRQNGENVNVNSLLNILQDEDSHKLITQVSFDNRWGEINQEEVPRMVNDCLRRLKKKRLTMYRSEIEQELKKSEKIGDREKIKSLLQEFEKIKSAERELYRGADKEGWSW